MASSLNRHLAFFKVSPLSAAFWKRTYGHRCLQRNCPEAMIANQSFSIIITSHRGPLPLIFKNWCQQPACHIFIKVISFFHSEQLWGRLFFCESDAIINAQVSPERNREPKGKIHSHPPPSSPCEMMHFYASLFLLIASGLLLRSGAFDYTHLLDKNGNCCFFLLFFLLFPHTCDWKLFVLLFSSLAI